MKEDGILKAQMVTYDRICGTDSNGSVKINESRVKIWIK